MSRAVMNVARANSPASGGERPALPAPAGAWPRDGGAAPPGRRSHAAGRNDMNTHMIRSRPEPGYRWFVRDAGSGAVLGWFDYQLAHWFADQERHSGREAEIGYSRRSHRQPPGAQQRQPRPEPEAGA